MTPVQFMKRVEVQPDGCWRWTGATGGARNHLYGVANGTTAHRVAYEFFVGPIPTGMVLDHLCRNTMCVNPEHLEPVTQRENLERGQGRSRASTHCKNGHEYTPENTRIVVIRGYETRVCRACKRDWARENRKR